MMLFSKFLGKRNPRIFLTASDSDFALLAGALLAGLGVGRALLVGLGVGGALLVGLGVGGALLVGLGVGGALLLLLLLVDAGAEGATDGVGAEGVAGGADGVTTGVGAGGVGTNTVGLEAISPSSSLMRRFDSSFSRLVRSFMVVSS